MEKHPAVMKSVNTGRFTPTSHWLKAKADTEYVVFPVIMLVEGVHQGIGTEPVFYSADVLSASSQAWGHMPVTLGHPLSQTGDHILCGHDGVILQEWQVGYIDNVNYEASGKLKGEVYLDKVKLEILQPGLIDHIKAGGQLEVSTGMMAMQDGTEGAWNDEKFSASILEILPDHLALLPGSVGACSWDDGCGIRWNQGCIINEGQKKEKILVLAGTELGATLDKVHSAVNSMDVWDQGKGTYLKSHYVRAVYDDYYVYKKREHSGANETEGLYRQNYSLDETGSVVLEGQPEEVVEDIQYRKKVTVGNTTNSGKTKQEDNSMKGKACCEKRVLALISNEHTAFTEADSEWLSALNEEQIEKLESNAEPVEIEKIVEKIVEKAPDHEGPVTLESWVAAAPGEIRAVINDGLKQLDVKRADLIQDIVANERNQFTEEALKGMDTDMLENLAAFIPRAFDYSGQVPAHLQMNEEVEEAYVPQTLGAALVPKKE